MRLLPDAWRKPGIRSSLAVLALACILPIAAMLAFLISDNYDRAQHELSEAAISRARAMATSIDKEFASTEAALHALVTSPFLAADDIRSFHAQVLQALPNIGAEQILLFDGAQKMLFSTRIRFGEPLPIAPTPPVLKRQFDSGEPRVSDLFFGRVVLHPVFVVTVPVKRDGAIVYFVNASFAPGRLTHVLTGQKLPNTWRATITDSSGSVVSRTHEIERFLGKKVSPGLLRRMGAASEGAFESRTLDGVPVLTAYSRSPLSTWTVVLGMPLEEVTAGLRRTLRDLIVATCAALVIGLWLAWFVGGRIVSSIIALIGPANALGSGGVVTLPPSYFKEASEVGLALQGAAEALRRAEHASHHDFLTGLPNRKLFHILVNQQLALCLRGKQGLAILYIDLDGFKAVNDAYGHAAGDELLRAVSMRITQVIRRSDLAARLGGDEFAVALIHSSPEGAQAVAGKLIDLISEPYRLGRHLAQVSASIGIAAYPESGADCESLLIRSDKAMYAAKSQGKRRFSVGAAVLPAVA
jgi:diguanylate cyclase (GGDEF)-like protein